MLNRLLLSLLVKLFLKDFEVTERQMTDGEYASAMTQLGSSPQLQKYLNILTGNTIRRHLYIKDMVEGAWYLGGIATIRKLVNDSKNFTERQEKGEPDISIT